MSTQQNFDGRIITQPGVYSNVKSGLKNIPNQLAYGDLLIIDTGSGAGCGGGSGINGQIVNGADSLTEFDNIEDFQDFVERGLWWLLCQPLFRPLDDQGQVTPGVSKITYIKAATTTAAYRNLIGVLDASDSASSGGGTLRIQTRNEGTIGNGVLNTVSELSKGYAFKVIRGKRNLNKYILQLFRGTFTGLDQNNLPYDNILEVNSKAELLAQSKEFEDFIELSNWMKTSQSFNKYFRYDEANSTISGEGKVDASILGTYASYALFSNGTESYSANDLTAALLASKKLPVDFVLCDKYGSDSLHANNLAILAYMRDESRFKPQVYVASGNDVTDFSTSLSDCESYDSQMTSLVHGAVKIPSPKIGSGFKIYDSIYQAANLLGREAGIEPQVPLTFKAISIGGLIHQLNDDEQKSALDAGLLVAIPDGTGRFECLKGINTLQDNEFLLNANGTTHSKQLYRIAHQLNKELIITAKKDLLNNPAGVNRNTLSTQDVINWIKNFLDRKTASPTSDNLILSYKDVTASRVSDAYKINYSFSANSEISFLFFTGFFLDIN